MDKLRIDVWSDIACPWCWVGKRNLEAAIAEYGGPVTARWHGTVLSVAPSTAHQMGLNMLEGVKQQIVMEPPACQLHLWQPDTGIVSHTSYTGQYEIPLSVELP